MNRIFTNMVLSIILIMGILGCGEQKTAEMKYEEAKTQAENKITELEEILIPLKAIKSGDLSALPTDPEDIKRMNEKADIKNIKKLSNEVNKALQKVFELKPDGYDDDYKQWTQQMKQRLDSVK